MTNIDEETISIESYDSVSDLLASSGLQSYGIQVDIVGPQDECPICLEDMDSCAGYNSPCFHKFHVSCMDEAGRAGGWFCPMCRAVVEEVVL